MEVWRHQGRELVTISDDHFHFYIRKELPSGDAIPNILPSKIVLCFFGRSSSYLHLINTMILKDIVSRQKIIFLFINTVVS